MFYCECSKGSPKAVCFCKRAKHKVYFNVLLRVQQRLAKGSVLAQPEKPQFAILLLFNLSPIKEPDSARGLLRLLLVVSNHHYGAPILLVQCVQNIHDFCSHL